MVVCLGHFEKKTIDQLQAHFYCLESGRTYRIGVAKLLHVGKGAHWGPFEQAT